MTKRAAFWLLVVLTGASLVLWAQVFLGSGLHLASIRLAARDHISRVELDRVPGGIGMKIWVRETSFNGEGGVSIKPLSLYPRTAFWLPRMCFIDDHGNVQVYWPCWAITGPLLIATLALRFWARRARPGRCAACGYDVSASPAARCPECGTLPSACASSTSQPG